MPSLKIKTARQIQNNLSRKIEDCLVVEEPLEIRLDGRRYTATMRTPGHDLELAMGLLLSEGVIRERDDIEAISASTLCRERSDELVNVVNVTLHDSSQIPAHLWERSLISNASCGLCGKSSIEAMSAQVQPLPETSPISLQVLSSLPEQLRAQQTLFAQTGGLHAAAIFDCLGNCLACFEDIGRHNATDKAIGFGLENGWLPWRKNEAAILLVSGRLSFEIAQKALMARLPILAGISAASSLAVELAGANNLTLAAFLRDNRATVYCGTQRIAG